MATKKEYLGDLGAFAREKIHISRRDAEIADEMLGIIQDQKEALFNYEAIYKSGIDTSLHSFLLSFF